METWSKNMWDTAETEAPNNMPHICLTRKNIKYITNYNEDVAPYKTRQQLKQNELV